MLRHFWRGVREFRKVGETTFHSFLFRFMGPFIDGFGYS